MIWHKATIQEGVLLGCWLLGVAHRQSYIILQVGLIVGLRSSTALIPATSGEGAIVLLPLLVEAAVGLLSLGWLDVAVGVPHLIDDVFVDEMVLVPVVVAEDAVWLGVFICANAYDVRSGFIVVLQLVECVSTAILFHIESKIYAQASFVYGLLTMLPLKC